VIYVDTGPFLGRYLARDQYHERSVEGWARVERTTTRCFTSNFVLDELLTLLGRWAGPSFAAQRARIILASDRLVILRPDLEDELAAVELMEKFGDQGVSFTDCISFALMRRRGLTRAYTFDRHFALAGFEIWP
jgi:uncharacterized protein